MLLVLLSKRRDGPAVCPHRRVDHPGGTYFFTVNLLQRAGNDLLTRGDPLRDAVRRVGITHPFEIDSGVVLPDHLHCVLRLPADNSDVTVRWRLIKAFILVIGRETPMLRPWPMMIDMRRNRLRYCALRGLARDNIAPSDVISINRTIWNLRLCVELWRRQFNSIAEQGAAF